LLLGVLGVTVLLLAGSVALALKPEQEASGVVGLVRAWPCRPVERAGDPPCPGHEGELRVLRPDLSLVLVTHADKNGRFRVELPPGRYLFDPGDGGVAEGRGHTTVREGAFTPVEVTYDTGLRSPVEADG
jgi:hypothetical protein